MRSYLTLLVLLLVIVSGCDEIEPIANPGTHPFYPYQIGDQYVIEEWASFYGNEFRDTITYRVVDVVKHNGKSYFRKIGTSDTMYLTGTEPLPRTPDTMLFRVEGSKVFSRSNVGEYVCIDFDAPYSFSLEPTAPMGFVKDTAGVEVQAGVFDGKLMRKAQPFSSHFVFAKDVGVVLQYSSEYRSSLISARVGGQVLP